MRKINYIFILVALIVVALTTSCKKKSKKDETDQEVKTKLLSKAWTVTGFSAGSSAIDVPTDNPVVITFTNGSYSITNIDWINSGYNNSQVLKASGTWAFSDNLNKIILDGGPKELTIKELTESSFKFSYMSSHPKPTDTEKEMNVTAAPK